MLTLSLMSSRLVAKFISTITFNPKHDGKALVSQPLIEKEDEMFVIIGSLDDDCHHPAANRIAGKKVRVEIYLEEEQEK